MVVDDFSRRWPTVRAIMPGLCASRRRLGAIRSSATEDDGQPMRRQTARPHPDKIGHGDPKYPEPCVVPGGSIFAGGSKASHRKGFPVDQIVLDSHCHVSYRPPPVSSIPFLPAATSAVQTQSIRPVLPCPDRTSRLSAFQKMQSVPFPACLLSRFDFISPGLYNAATESQALPLMHQEGRKP